MDILSQFGETFSDLLFDGKISPEKFADSVNLDVSVVYRYLRKEVVPSFSNAILIADYFNCSLDFLIGITPEHINVKYKTAPPFSCRFKEILAEYGYSRYRLCKESHLFDQSVDDWYHGKRIPTVECLIRLSKFFGCTLDYIVGRD